MRVPSSGQLTRTSLPGDPVILTRPSARVLDAGGWYRPFNLATHVIDLNPYELRRVDDALDPEDDERFTADTWIVQDVCNSPWPFPWGPLTGMAKASEIACVTYLNA